MVRLQHWDLAQYVASESSALLLPGSVPYGADTTREKRRPSSSGQVFYYALTGDHLIDSTVKRRAGQSKRLESLGLRLCMRGYGAPDSSLRGLLKRVGSMIFVRAK